ncbi:POR [Lepeophtheirus salmonis]|uniref:POR n=1 Tax=Lepeophtheirus salmonis TaxID=72036 RepID=A0A7R8CD40_LEPSM|nr:POR [Lepeophtheirus salmonis]CAF2777474.1 POR [Lepeophtheirus salmonis]
MCMAGSLSNAPTMFFMSLFCLLVAAQGQEEEGTSQNTTSDTREEQEPLLGLTDYVLLVIVLLVGYWYFFKDDSKSSSSNLTSFKYELTPESPSSGNDEAQSFLSKMKNKKSRMVVFYGSQTGTAEEFAARLANEGIRYGLKDGSPTLAVFCLATYGEGDPTDNAQEFFEWLQTGSCNLSTMTFAVFGLGNKTYEHFNAMGIHKLGKGDDDDNLENDFVTWKDEFWASVCQEFGIGASDMEFSLRQYSAEVLESPDPKRIIAANQQGSDHLRLRGLPSIKRIPISQKSK